MIYKMTLTDSSDTMTFNLLETPIVDKDIEGAVDNVTLDGNQYTDYLYLKKQYIQKWAIMCPDEYDQLRGFYTRQFEEGEVPSYRVYYGANVTKDYTYTGDSFQFNAKGIETGMYLSRLTGNATQDGTPTPDAPVPISTVTGVNTVKMVGKNLFDVSKVLTNSNNTLVNNGEGSLTVKGLAVSGATPNTLADYCPTLKVGDVATLSATTTATANKYIYLYGVNQSWAFGASKTITQAMLESRVAFYSSSGTGEDTISNIQLELGSQPSVYQPYQGQEFPIDLGSIELCKIGTYQDRIYKDEGKWYIEKQVGKVTFDGSEDGWMSEGGGAPYRMPMPDFSRPSPATIFAISDYFESVPYNANWNNYTSLITTNATGSATAFKFRYTAITSLADWKTWLASNPTTVYYALATPTTTEITDETLLAQLNFIASLYEGVNNISIVGTGAQGEMVVLIRDVLDVETDVVPETPVRLTLTDGGVINACGCRRDVQLTMRETTE